MISMLKTKAIVEALVKLRGLATDEQAVEVPVLYPAWRIDHNYVAGERVLYNEILYKVLLDHTSQTNWAPDVAPSLFAKVLIPDENTIYPWEQPDSTNLYMIGDKVSHNDKIWISTVDNNSWEPGVYGWEEYAETEEEPITPEEPTTTPEEENGEAVIPDKEETGESTIPDEGENDETIAAWEQPNSTNPYMINNKVNHNGQTWISIVDNNVWEPGIYGWDPISE